MKYEQCTAYPVVSMGSIRNTTTESKKWRKYIDSIYNKYINIFLVTGMEKQILISQSTQTPFILRRARFFAAVYLLPPDASHV